MVRGRLYARARRRDAALATGARELAAALSAKIAELEGREATLREAPLPPPPPDRPSSVRGTTVTAHFEISSRGEVMRVSLDPMPRDRKFADAFLDRLKRYTFTPAYTLDGHPVAAAFEIRIML